MLSERLPHDEDCSSLSQWGSKICDCYVDDIAQLEAQVEQYQTDLAETEQGTPVGGRQMTVMENWWMNEKGKREQLEADNARLREALARLGHALEDE